MTFPPPPVVASPTAYIPPHPADVNYVSRVASPAVAALGHSPSDEAVDAFWADISRRGTPLIEDVTRTQCTYTFVYRGDHQTQRVALAGTRLIDPTVPAAGLFEHLPGTDIWWFSVRHNSSWRGSYQIAVDDGTPRSPADPAAERRRTAAVRAADPQDRPAIVEHFDLIRHGQPDPLCRQRHINGIRMYRSVAAGPDAPAPPWLPSAPAGRLLPVVVRGVPMWWHIPAIPPPTTWHTLVLLDGEMWYRNTAMLDSLVGSGAIPPTVSLLVTSGDSAARAAALTCNPDFIATIIDAIEQAPLGQLGASREQQTTGIAGRSFGGLAALYAQCVAPEQFSFSICQSPSLWWPNAPDPQWLTTAIDESTVQLGYVYLEMGTGETPVHQPMMRLRKVLADRCHTLELHVFEGGHDAACWDINFPSAIERTWQILHERYHL